MIRAKETIKVHPLMLFAFGSLRGGGAVDLSKVGIFMLMLLIATGPATAADKQVLLEGSRLAFSRILTNDYIGDRKDRWRTFAYAISMLKPLKDGSVGELRFRTEIIAGRTLKLAPGQDPDRRMAGVFGFGAYRSDRIGNGDYRIGVELTTVGPQTRLIKLQERFHELIDQTGPSTQAKNLQISDKIFLSFRGEIGQDFKIGRAAIRPWAAAEGGPEALARVGIDFIWGHSSGNFGVRDELTGWRVPVLQNRNTYGRSFIAGFDIAHVKKSFYITEDYLIKNRFRLRTGSLVDFDGGRIFYGATYLSEEFKAQPEAQVVGSISFSMHF